MKKLIFLLTIVSILVSNSLYAWEATFDAGYYGRLFDQKDQLGATRPKQDIKFNFTNGLALNGNILFGVKSFSFGPELSLNYGLTNTESLQTQAISLSLMSQYNHGSLNFGLKTGVTTNILTQDYMDKLDADTGFIFGFKASADIFEGQRFFFEPQLFLSPTTELSFAPSFAFVIGIQKIIKPETVKPVAIVLPKEETPVKLAEPATPVQEPVIVLEPVVVKQKIPEPVVLPEAPTPTQIEKPKPLTLNFIGNEVDPASTLLGAVIKAYNKSPSIILILHKKESKNRANSVATYFKKNGVNTGDIQIKAGLKDNSIKISVVNKK